VTHTGYNNDMLTKIHIIHFYFLLPVGLPVTFTSAENYLWGMSTNKWQGRGTWNHYLPYSLSLSCGLRHEIQRHLLGRFDETESELLVAE